MMEVSGHMPEQAGSGAGGSATSEAAPSGGFMSAPSFFGKRDGYTWCDGPCGR